MDIDHRPLVSQPILDLPLPNKRLKLAGGDRFEGSGVLCDGGHGLRPTALRRRAVRPQVKRDPLGAQRGRAYIEGAMQEESVKRSAPVLHSDPEILGGTPVFVGTRVPVQSLFDYLRGGETLDEFLHQFPSVQREQAVAALELARDALVTGARPA